MAKPKKGNGESPQGDDKQRRPPEPTGSKPGNPDADPVRIHRGFVERRVGKGAAPSAEAYARALEQWHRLPGAVSTPPTEVRGADAEIPPKNEDGRQSKDTPSDKERS